MPWILGSLGARRRFQLREWRVLETDKGNRHFIGLKKHDEATVSRKVEMFDVKHGTGATVSSRVYQLEGRPGYVPEVDARWRRWKKKSGIRITRDISNEVFSEMLHAGFLVEDSREHTAKPLLDSGWVLTEVPDDFPRSADVKKQKIGDQSFERNSHEALLHRANCCHFWAQLAAENLASRHIEIDQRLETLRHEANYWGHVVDLMVSPGEAVWLVRRVASFLGGWCPDSVFESLAGDGRPNAID